MSTGFDEMPEHRGGYWAGIEQAFIAEMFVG
jgi:hypothetical protein